MPQTELRKSAAGDDSTFESSLATIGRTSLASRAQKLFEHELGFQVIDKNDDNTRAVGVFGFRVGRKLLYVPMFYRKGKVKGTEQLRDPGRNMCVPLSDGWVNYYLSGRPDEIGTGISRSALRDTSQPNLWQLKLPPTKYASWAAEAAAHLSLSLGRTPSLLARPGGPAGPLLNGQGPDLLKAAAARPELLDALGTWCVRYPWFGNAVRKYHGTEKVAAALATAETRHKLAASVLAPRRKPTRPILPQAKRAAVLVIKVTTTRIHSTPLAPELEPTDAEKAELEAGRNSYRDDRKDDEVAVPEVWSDQTSGTGETLSNPPATGLYKVLTEGGELEDCIVAFPLVGITPRDHCLVVRLSDKAHTVLHRNSVWVRGTEDRAALGGWVDGLPKVSEGEGGEQVVLSDTGACTVPFRWSDGGPEAHWSTHPWLTDLSDPLAPPSGGAGTPVGDLYAGTRAGGDQRVRVVEDRTGEPVFRDNTIYLPANARRLSLGEGSRLRLGRSADADHFQLRASKKVAADVRALTVRPYRLGVEVEAFGKTAGFRDPADAEAALVAGCGLRPADARRLTDAGSRRETTVWAKYAAPAMSNLPTDWPNAPAYGFDTVSAPTGFADDIAPSEVPYSLQTPIPDLLMTSRAMERARPWPTESGIDVDLPGIGNSAGGGAADAGPDEGDMRAVSDAAVSGSRELFDTAALAALVKHTRLPTLREETDPRMLRTVTDLGDNLAHLAWNADAWAQRYGRGELGALEDQLKDMFTGLGDLYLTLQEQAAEDDPPAGVLPEEDPGDAGDAD